jgi:hypothetical protein
VGERHVRAVTGPALPRPDGGAPVALSGDMDDPGFEVLNVAEARRALTQGDIRSDVAFQNDVNRLLAALDELERPAQGRSRCLNGRLPGP